MENLKIAMYDNANSLRMHQDNLRWKLLAGYFVFFGTGFTLIERGILPKEPYTQIPLFLFVVGNLFLLILTVESWYYNLYSEYVKICEANLIENKTLETLQKFRDCRAKTISPFHYSYIFALLINICSNALYAYCFFGWKKLGIGSYFLISILLLITWKYTVYMFFLHPLNWLFKLLHKKTSKS